MDMRHLRYFVAVAEEQNVSRAAARLHVSQPPLSRQIRDLERDLGVPLFKRTPTAIKLTEAGRVFLMEARAVLQRVDEAVELGQAAARGRMGQVRVGYAASPTVEVLPRALRIFKDTSPGVSVQLRDMGSRAMLKGLREGSLDVALVVSVTPSDFAGLELEEIGSYPPCVAMHLKHRLSRSRTVQLKDIAKEPFLAFSGQDHPEHHVFLAKIFGAKSKIPPIVEEYATVNSMIAAVEAGRGVAVVFGTIALLAGRRLALRSITPDPGRFPIALVYRKEGATAATLDFVEATRRAKPRSS
jgi:LysR family transcriptional regulator, benzoate and cis,cis-muconate-responsive activator of ben and cat genes